MITSISNPHIKELRSLQKSRIRKDLGLFVVEGTKEIEKALSSGIEPESVYYCPDLISEPGIKRLLPNNTKTRLQDISLKVFNSLVYRENSGGLLIVAKKPSGSNLNQLQLKANALILVLESVEKPGNLGAILRTADAAGVDAIILCDQKTDLHNPNVIRSSLGCIFTVPTFVSDTPTTIAWLKAQGVSIYCAALSASKPHYQADLTGRTAVVMGTESVGLTDAWLKESNQNIIIPMKGSADSMNVSTSAAVILFEAIRQRTA